MSTDGPDSGGPTPLPDVSIVVPVRNEEASIEACLASLLAQTYPRERMEVLVVDGRSTDDTKSIVRTIAQRHPDVTIRTLDNPRHVVSTALNVGIREARADIVLRMDGHTAASPTYVAHCVRAMRATGAANVGGCIAPVAASGFARMVALAQAHPLGAGGARFHYATRPQYVDTVYLGGFDKSLLAVCGLYDESLVRNQDYELNIRIRKAGGKIYLDPAIASSYTPRSTPAKLWKQYFEYGWWKVETLRRHPDSLRPRQLAPVLFVAMVAILVLAGTTLVAAWPSVAAAARWTALLTIGAYTCALLAATLLLARRLSEPPAALAGFATALAILHVAWGAGFLVSLASRGRFPYRAQPPNVPRLG